MTLSKNLPKSVPMSASSDDADDPVLLAAVQEYLALLDAGEAPDRREFSRRFVYQAVLAGLGQSLDMHDQRVEARPLFRRVHLGDGARIERVGG